MGSCNTKFFKNTNHCDGDALCLDFLEYLLVVQNRLENGNEIIKLETKYYLTQNDDIRKGETLIRDQELAVDELKIKTDKSEDEMIA